MEKIKFYLEKYKLYIIISIICITILGILFLMLFNKEEKNIIEKEIVIEEKKEVNKEITTVRVDVKGRVKKEGVYELSSDSRVIDAINKAGGFKDNANTDYINLSKKLVDEMIIIIYSDDEVNKFREEEKQIIYIEYKCECPDNINDSCITKDDVVNTNGVEDKKEESKKEEDNKKEENNKNEETTEKNNKEDSDVLISINKGTKEELMTLPGIGESKANNIIKYREEHGDFEILEDIKNVSGIGESAYSKIKDLIKL